MSGEAFLGVLVALIVYRVGSVAVMLAAQGVVRYRIARRVRMHHYWAGRTDRLFRLVMAFGVPDPRYRP